MRASRNSDCCLILTTRLLDWENYIYLADAIIQSNLQYVHTTSVGKREEKYEREKTETQMNVKTYNVINSLLCALYCTAVGFASVWAAAFSAPQMPGCVPMWRRGVGDVAPPPSIHTRISRPHSLAGGFSVSLTPGMGPGYWERGVDRPGCGWERGSIRTQDTENRKCDFNFPYCCIWRILRSIEDFLLFTVQSLHTLCIGLVIYFYCDNCYHSFMQIKYNWIELREKNRSHSNCYEWLYMHTETMLQGEFKLGRKLDKVFTCTLTRMILKSVFTCNSSIIRFLPQHFLEPGGTLEGTAFPYIVNVSFYK